MFAEHKTVPETLRFMQDAVKRGAISDASRLGAECTPSLALTPVDITLGDIMSSGAESRVYHGTLHSRPVAIKKPIIRTSQDLDRFRQELSIMSTLRHPSIIPLLGARVLPPDYYLVMPFDGESYYHAIHEKGHQPSWQEIVELGCQLAGAMEHVHDQGILHRDLKTRNVLRGADGWAKIIDFGIAREINAAVAEAARPSGGFHKQHLVGTLEYMAPEVLQKEGHSFASDVYAFGVMLNEMATGVYPFSDCTKDNPDAHTVLEMGYGRQELAAAVVAEGLRPTLPDVCPAIFADLTRACWNLDPSKRPSFTQIHDQFTSILSQMNNLGVDVCLSTKKRLDFIDHSSSISFPLELEGRGVIEGDGAWFEEGVSDMHQVTLTCGVFATAGFRGEDKMEDRHLIATDILGRDSAALLGVFDGHRGSEASEFMLHAFQETFCSSIALTASADDALTRAYAEIEHGFSSSSKAKIHEARGMRFPGCTALTALIHGDQLLIANAGDCRAVLCRDGDAFQLSRDHTAMDVHERKRIEAHGSASLHWQKGSWRIGDAGIQVTRSIGDVDLKSSGLSYIPEVTSFNLTASDSFLIIASDGLWDVLANEEATGIVQDTVKQPDMCAKRLATEALSRGSQDNITVIVCFLKPVATLERIFVDGHSKYSHSRALHAKAADRMATDEVIETL